MADAALKAEVAVVLDAHGSNMEDEIIDYICLVLKDIEVSRGERIVCLEPLFEAAGFDSLPPQSTLDVLLNLGEAAAAKNSVEEDDETKAIAKQLAGLLMGAEGPAAAEDAAAALAQEEDKTEMDFAAYFGASHCDPNSGIKRRVIEKYAHEFDDTVEVGPDGKIRSALEDLGVSKSLIKRNGETDHDPLSTMGHSRNKEVSEALLKSQREKSKQEAEK